MIKLEPSEGLRRSYNPQKNEINELNRSFKEYIEEVEQLKVRLRVAKKLNHTKRAHILESVLNDKIEFLNYIKKTTQRGFYNRRCKGVLEVINFGKLLEHRGQYFTGIELLGASDNRITIDYINQLMGELDIQLANVESRPNRRELYFVCDNKQNIEFMLYLLRDREKHIRELQSNFATF